VAILRVCSFPGCGRVAPFAAKGHDPTTLGLPTIECHAPTAAATTSQICSRPTAHATAAKALV
jgi:hypothetical protein